MLNRLAARLCAVYALAGRTFAGAEVRDSEIVPIDPAGEGDDVKPFIAVYTDDQSPDGVTLTIEIGASARMATVDDTGQDVIVAGVPPTDAGIEALIDMMERQIHVAFADETNAWSSLLDVVCPNLAPSGSQRGAMKSQEGERFAGRQIIFTGKLLSDPEFGRAIAPGGFWARFLELADTEPALVGFTAQIRALLTDGASVEDWRLVLRALGHGRIAGDALGIGPADGDTDEPIVGFETEGGPVQ